jgi:hypothetical protein
MLEEIAAPGKVVPTINFVFAVCGVLGGLVGSTTLAFALWSFYPAQWLRT